MTPLQLLNTVSIVTCVAAVAFMAGDYLLTLHGSIFTKRLARGVLAIAVLVGLGVVLHEALPPAVLLLFTAVLMHRANTAARNTRDGDPPNDAAKSDSERPSSAA